MKFESLYSSSKGNLYRVTSQSGKVLLIDPGVRWRKLVRALDHTLNNIVGCLISHQHADHANAGADVHTSGIDVYANIETLQSLHIDGLAGSTILEHYMQYEIGPFLVFTFPVQHDVPNFGFIVSENTNREHLLFAVDCANIQSRYRLRFTEIAIGCSYDRDILKERETEGDINTSLAERLLYAHMEKSKTQQYLVEFCDMSNCKKVHLLHMSGDNIDKELAREEIEDALEKKHHRRIPVMI
jgi:phosphoribosyl 1,2-cyclic phosphodiesterase